MDPERFGRQGLPASGAPTHRAHVRQRDTVQRHTERLRHACVDLGLGHLTATIGGARQGVEPVGDTGVGVDAAEETATVRQRRNEQGAVVKSCPAPNCSAPMGRCLERPKSFATWIIVRSQKL
jgi:hypothetical protein